ncbi:hypothetical protein CFN78_22530 [Amycolatopsis antarctica]|uniref:Secreted protein n=1 Tax=Amycolatopsis antarctica TaxID=1854586 RepID=A0A263D0P8_9PSEU|nr:hypothetical protein CFN78_22530 [Amycolatopsis antarctica]
MTATAAIASGAALAFAGTASATTEGPQEPLTICAKGDYDTFAVFPDRGGLATANVEAGTCLPFEFGDSGAVEEIEVYGYVEPKGSAGAPTTFHVATGHWRASKGGTVNAFGTIEQNDATFPLL